MKNQLKNVLIAACIFTISGCASMGSPDGGPRDTEAPTLVATSPKNGQTNVNPEKIILTFDEPIQALDLNRQLIIAPLAGDNTYKTKIKDNVVEITFEEPWLENTTYSLNFRKSIGDITEKNLAKNVSVTFSTGAYLDSGSVSGTVNYLYSLSAPKEANILLYPASDTSQITKGKPLYVAQTDSVGNFSLKNVKEGNYHLYALAEMNNNLRYDNEKEAIAFLTDSITIKPNTAGITLQLHYQDKTKPITSSRKSFLNLYEVEYNEGLANVKVKKATDANASDIKWVLSNAGKTLRLFPSVPEENKWVVEAQDSAGNSKIDTLSIRLAGARAPIRNNSFQIANGQTVKPGDTLRLEFEIPSKIVNPEGAITFKIDSVTSISTKVSKDLILNENGTVLKVKLPAEAVKEVGISLDTTKIVPFIGLPFSKTTTKITISDRASVGSLKIALATTQQSFFVQLLKDNKIVRETKNKKTVLWENLEPGNYQVRVLVDSNGNGVWDNGDLKTRRLPEPVILNPATFEIRANWDIVEETPITF